MEAALDLSAAVRSAVRIKTDDSSVDSSLNSSIAAYESSMSQAPVNTQSPTSSNQSPTSSTMTNNSVFPMHFYRNLIANPYAHQQPPAPLLTPSSASFPINGGGSMFDNPALATLASALAAQGFLSPGAGSPAFANFFNSSMAAAAAAAAASAASNNNGIAGTPTSISPGGGPSPISGGTNSVVTPPASAPGVNFFSTGGTSVPPNGTSTPEPPSSFLPSATLAMSTLHRRRRPNAFQYRRQSQSDLGLSPNGQQQQQQSDDQSSTPDSGDGSVSLASGKRVKTGSIPNEKKDELYWERRRKNNEAAKRSRDSRRAKEEEIVVRAAFLEQENLKLKAQVAVLKNETAKLHFMLLNHTSA